MLNLLRTKRNILTRGLPKTSQSDSYHAGDDGEYEAGWWVRRNLSNNRTRYISETLNGDQIVIDRATGLWWPKDLAGAGCIGGLTDTWNDLLDFCNALSFAGFSDWRMPNINELFSITYQNDPDYFLDRFIFDNTDFRSLYWSSTTLTYFTSKALTYSRSDSFIYGTGKTVFCYIHPCRGGV